VTTIKRDVEYIPKESVHFQSTLGCQSKGIQVWRSQVKNDLKVKGISNEKSVRNHEEENGSRHGFECKGDGA
jgi:hypothetical protein